MDLADILEVMRTTEQLQNTYEYLTESNAEVKVRKWKSRTYYRFSVNSISNIAIRRGESQFADAMKTANGDIPVIMSMIKCIELWIMRGEDVHRYMFDVDWYKRNLIFRDDIMNIPDSEKEQLSDGNIYRMISIEKNTIEF
jgi:hypothetical protein